MNEEVNEEGNRWENLCLRLISVFNALSIFEGVKPEVPSRKVNEWDIDDEVWKTHKWSQKGWIKSLMNCIQMIAITLKRVMKVHMIRGNQLKHQSIMTLLHEIGILTVTIQIDQSEI